MFDMPKFRIDPAKADWRAYQTFLAVYRSGSLSRAATELKLTQPTVGRRLERLEQALQVSLFTRSPSGLKPTDIAHLVAKHARTMESAVQAVPRDLSDALTVGRHHIRLTTAEIFAFFTFREVLPTLHEAIPNLALEINLGHNFEDILNRDVDLAIRMSNPKHKAVVAQKLGEIELGLFAHRSIINKHGVPGTINEMRGMPLIKPRLSERHSAITGLFEAITDPNASTVETESRVMQFIMAQAGFGVGVFYVKGAGTDRDLVRILPEAFAVRLGVWLAMHEDLRRIPYMRKAFSVLSQGIKRYLK